MVRRPVLFCFLMLLPWIAYGQTGLSCQAAITLPGTQFCSDSAKYNNSVPVQNGVTWFKFKAVLTVITVTISGQGTGGSLTTPSAKIYADCPNTVPIAEINSLTANIGTVHAEGLTIGNTYYIAVTGSNLGTFNLCFFNYEPSHTDGPDCSTAQNIYGTNDVKFSPSIGAGTNTNEAVGTCVDGTELYTTWIKWKAANNGSLVFTLIPDIQTNNLDFVLYDLGPSGDCSGVTVANSKRCAAGSGVACMTGRYYKTGLSFDAQDITESAGCITGQDGAVKSLNMTAGNTYALLVNNTSASAGFTLKFNDVLNGSPGTAQFGPPAVNINYTEPNCGADRTYVFNNYLTTTNQFSYDFDQGATIKSADARNNFYVVYDSAGPRTVTLTINGQLAAQKIIDVPASLIISSPVISALKEIYCVGDTIILSTSQVNNNVYTWTGPGGYIATGATVRVPVTSGYKAGPYTLVAVNGACPGGTAFVTPNISPSPDAEFTASPQPNITIASPATVKFINSSTGADNYLWDFGDSGTSTDLNPTHVYTKSGSFHVKLTAFNTNGCLTSLTEGNFVIKNENILFLYDTFTPNGDNINDRFTVKITNTQSFHIQVFNRYGSLVFETRDQSVNWDGTYKGTNVSAGVYYYIIDATGLDGNLIKESGHVTLIR